VAIEPVQLHSGRLLYAANERREYGGGLYDACASGANVDFDEDGPRGSCSLELFENVDMLLVVDHEDDLERVGELCQAGEDAGVDGHAVEALSRIFFSNRGYTGLM
jgi:hypothetical protein